jgi:ribosomal protein S18 acetylase RimI-like enzyme
MDLTGLQRVLPDHDVRPLTFDDVPAMVDLVARLTTVILGEPDVTEAEIRDDLSGPHFDIEADTFIALGPEGRATAYGQGDDEHTGTGWIDVYLDPAIDDARFATVADAAVAACVERIIESARGRGADSVHITANLYDNETRMRSAYERAGLELETIYWRMQRAIAADEQLEVPVVPDGFRIGKVDPRDDDVLEQAYHLFHDTFSEHHGIEGSKKSLPDYTDHVRKAESFDPESWWFAWQDKTPVGLLIGDNRRMEQGVGYVRSVGVQKHLRGRGIARALLLTALADYQRRGRRTVQLGVDTGNTTGATRLYESVGMTSIGSAVALGREVTL